jgi:hypothetical protein
MLHAAVLRSPHAHARIRTIDKSKAEALPGVIAVITRAEAAAYSGPLPSFSSPPVVQYAIARDRVRHVGEPVVAVVAESRYVAEDAIELIAVEYEPLPVVAGLEIQGRGGAASRSRGYQRLSGAYDRAKGAYGRSPMSPASSETVQSTGFSVHFVIKCQLRVGPMWEESLWTGLPEQPR